MHRVAWLFIQTVTYLFQHANDIADGPVLILDSHVDDAPVVRDSVKGDMHLDTPLAELLPDVIRESHKGATLVRNGFYQGIKTVLSIRLFLHFIVWLF